MSNQTKLQAIVIEQETTDKSSTPIRLSLFSEDGSPIVIPDAYELVPAEAHPDSEAATLPELVADFNGLLAKLRTAGFIEEEA